MLIPSDRDVVRWVNEGEPIVLAKPRSEAAKAFARSPTSSPPIAAAWRPEAPAPAAGGRAYGTPERSRPSGRFPSQRGATPSSRSRTGSTGESSPSSGHSCSTPRSSRRCSVSGSRTDIRTRLAAERGLSATTATASSTRSPTTSSATGRSSGCSPTTRHRDHGQRPVRHLDRAPGPPVQTTVRFSDESHLRRIVNKIVAQVGRRVDESSPMVDARLPDGSRVNAVIPPLSLSGSLLTIRKFGKKRLDLQDMIRLGTLSTETVDLLQRCLQARAEHPHLGRHRLGQDDAAQRAVGRSPTTSGSSRSRMRPSFGSTSGTSCASRRGRRTSRARARSRSATSFATHCACVPTGSSSERSAAPEALDMLQAMNTGHDGSLTTVHANSPRDALARVETMVLMAGFDLPVRAIRQQVASALDLIVHLERLDDGTRRVVAITEVQRMESDVITLQDLFTFKVEKVTGERVVVGSLRVDRPAADVPVEVREARRHAATQPVSGSAGRGGHHREAGDPMRRARSRHHGSAACRRGGARRCRRSHEWAAAADVARRAVPGAGVRDHLSLGTSADDQSGAGDGERSAGPERSGRSGVARQQGDVRRRAAH